MRREEFEHAIRAVGSILGIEEVLVIGSQGEDRSEGLGSATFL